MNKLKLLISIFVYSLASLAVCVRAQSAFIYDLPGNLTTETNLATVPLPQFQQTGPQYVIANMNGLFSVSVPVIGTCDLSYQWLFNGAPITGATNSSFTMTNATSANLGDYQLVAANCAGVVTSAVVVVSYDTNQRGLPDAWQIQYFGSIGVNPNADPENDGIDNYQAYLDGDNPTNANQIKPLLNLSGTPGGTVIATPLQPYYQLGSTVQITAVPNPGYSFVGWSGSITNTNTTVNVLMNTSQTIVGNFGLPLTQVLDNPNLVWTTGGNRSWFGETNTSYDGVSAAQSGVTLVGQQSWLQTIITNPVLTGVYFEWAVSSYEQNYSSLYVNGSDFASISGGGGSITWQSKELYLQPGTNVLQWVYAENFADNDYGWDNLDTAWLDEVHVVPNPLIVSWGDNASGESIPETSPSNFVAITAGWYHNLALQSNGTIVGWGDNIYGESTPPAGLSNVVAIAAGYDDSLALQGNGTVVAWGYNGYGDTNVPVGLSNVTAIAAGAYHSLALESNGTVTAWGYNGYGQTNVPVGLSNVVAIAGGQYHSLALENNGTVVGWGENTYGESTSPPGLSNVVAIAAGDYYSVALESNGTVVAWGYNSYGQTNVPTGLTNVTAIAAGVYHILALKNDGTVTGWGDNSFGESAGLAGFSNIVAVAAGYDDSMGLIGNGPPFISAQPDSTTAFSGTMVELIANATGVWPLNYQWNYNGSPLPGATNRWLVLENPPSSASGAYSLTASNALGIVTSSNAILTVLDTAPIVTAQPQNQVNVQGGTVDFSVSVTGSLPVTYQWQFDGTNILGATNSTLTLSNVTATGEGNYQVVISNAFGGVTSSNVNFTLVPSLVFAWGYNYYGETNVPAGLTNVTAVAAGVDHNLALEANGTVVAWGYDGYGQTNVPAGLSNVTAVAAGLYHSLALETNGTVAAWGYNGYGETTVPAGLSNVVAIAAGYYHSLALENDGTVIGWGDNSYGESGAPAGLSNVVAIAAGDDDSLALEANGTVVAWGNGGNGQTNVPAGLSNVTAIAAGVLHDLALGTNGTVAAWGYNGYGETSVPAGLSNVTAIAAGNYHSLALETNGTVIGWGDNSYQESRERAGLPAIVAIAGGDDDSLALLGSGAPLISQQPMSASVYSGNTIELIGSAAGLSLAYQWNFNGSPLPGETNSWLIFNSAASSVSGTYGLTISNALGTVTSSNATLSVVNSAPIVTAQPQNQVNVQGATSDFSVSVTGSLPVTYQWQFDGTNILGATNSTLTLSNLTSASDGNYQVVISNAFGEVISSNVNFSPVPTLVFAWGYNNYGQTNVPAGLTNVTAVAAGFYHNLALEDGTVVAWGYDGNDQTNVPPGLSNVTAIAAGQYHNLALESNGMVVAWGYNGYGQTNVPAGLSNVVAIAGGYEHSLALENDGTVIGWGDNSYGESAPPAGLSNVVAIAAGYYDSLALEANGTVVAWGYSGYGETNVPIGLSNVIAIAAGAYHDLALQANGTITAWGYDGYGQTGVSAGLSNVIAIAAGEYHSLALESNGMVIGRGENSYEESTQPAGLPAIVAIAGGADDSLALLGSGAPLISLQPMGATVYSGSTVELIATAAGGSPLGYQWNYNGSPLPGATNSWLVFNNASSSASGAYSLTVSNALGTVTSSNANLTVLTGPPMITQPPLGQSISEGTSATFSVTAVGSLPLSYTWLANGTPIGGATNSSFTTNGVPLSANNSQFSCVVTNSYGAVTSQVATLAVFVGSLVQNGGFELGSFADWTESGNFEDSDVTTGSFYAHSGLYGAELGPVGSLGYISQTLPTSIGQPYLISCWLDCDGENPNEFVVSWNGTILFDGVNLPVENWTNLQFIAPATASGTVLSFGFRDDPSYLGLDDISVVPIQPITISSIQMSGTNLVINGINGISGETASVLTSTNLALPLAQWTPIATNILSGNGNFTITVTNAVSAGALRQYYILQSH